MENKEDLIKTMEKAIENKRGIAIAIQMPGQNQPEIIINDHTSLNNKMEYYKKAYNDELKLKANSEIVIIGAAEIESKSLFVDFNMQKTRFIKKQENRKQDNTIISDEEKLNDMIFMDIGICGCGNPEEAVAQINEILKNIRDNSQKGYYERRYKLLSSIDNETLLNIILYILDDKEYIEHGTNIYGAWITDKGKEFIRLIEKTGIEKLMMIKHMELDKVDLEVQEYSM